MIAIKKYFTFLITILSFLKGKIRLFLSLLNVRKFPVKKKIHFFSNLAVGIFIAVICHSLQYTTWGEIIINKVLDTYIESESRLAVKNPQNIDKGNLVFVEIDHDTYVEWGEPVITPRDKLAEIIKKCYDAGAKVILPDMVFESEQPPPGNFGDKKLIGVLDYILEKEKKRRCDKNRIDENPFGGIVFCRKVGFRSDLKKSFFYDLFKEKQRVGNVNIFYQAVSLFSSNADDNVVRYWNSYKTYFKKDGEEDLIWGAPLLTAMVYEDKAVRLGSIKKKLLFNKKNNLYGENERFSFEGGNEYHLMLNSSHTFSQRIRFNIIPTVFGNLNNRDVKLEGNTWILSVKYNEDFDNVGDAFFRNKIVVIGNTSPDIGDMHRTPIGNLAGSYLLGNAVNTILNTKQVKYPHWWMGYLIELFIIVAAAYLFLYLMSFLVLFISIIFILFGLVELGYWYFMETGFFLNSGLIFMGMVFHKITADMEESFSKRRFVKERLSKA